MIAVVVGIAVSKNCRRAPDPPDATEARSTINPIEQTLDRFAEAPAQEGIAAAILLDVSGSMDDPVQDASGRKRPKIAIARESVAGLLEKFDGFAREHPDRKMAVGIYEFSRRDHLPSTRVVVPLGPPDLAAARSALAKVRAKGGTPIGDAMIDAKRALDATGFSHRHILVVTDGENTHGYAPGDVASVLSRQAAARRASVYFVAFDIQAEVFKPVRDAGGLVLAAANETDLRQTLDYVLTGKILAEQPTTR